MKMVNDCPTCRCLIEGLKGPMSPSGFAYTIWYDDNPSCKNINASEDCPTGFLYRIEDRDDLGKFIIQMSAMLSPFNKDTGKFIKNEDSSWMSFFEEIEKAYAKVILGVTAQPIDVDSFFKAQFRRILK